jgi:hypothetical protein
MAQHPQHRRAVHQHANNEFIGACQEFDQLLAHLATLRRDHFGVDPDGQRTWAEVGVAREGVRLLREAVATLALWKAA